VCLKIRRRYFCRRGHFKSLIYDIPAKTRGFAGAFKTSAQNVRSITLTKMRGKWKKNPDLRTQRSRHAYFYGHSRDAVFGRKQTFASTCSLSQIGLLSPLQRLRFVNTSVTTCG
jgi:hypothetical protein